MRQTATLLVALVVLMGQLAFGPALLLATSDDLGAIPICHSGTPNSSPDQHHGSGECALCVICHAVGVAAVLPEPAAVAPPPPMAVVASGRRLPPSRAPPEAAPRAAFYPTGPPLLA